VFRTLNLGFDDFGWESLDARAAAERTSIDGLISRAAAHYASELMRRRPATRLPRHLGRAAAGHRARVAAVTVGLPASEWNRLRVQAARQREPIEALLEHASLLYLADADRGRLAAR